MKNIYRVSAVVLAVLLELGIFYLYHLGIIGNATTLSFGFAVGAVLVTSLMLRDVGLEQDDRGQPSE
jgi:hypothetical protein